MRAAGLATAVAGVILFVFASLTTPLAGARSVAGKPAPRTSVSIPAPIDVEPAAPSDPPPPGVAEQLSLQRKPTHTAKAAPVNHAVISGLAANGIPNVALNAYRVAAARMDNVDPACGIGWWLLAGIGREESDHGQFAGAVLHADGTSTPRIIGPALDGRHWDYIPAPANGLALDGDARYAHALGPMQFIPSTWAIYGTDANGDGTADVFNINDAALGAARYLCAAGGDLRTQAGQVAAVLAYNHSDQYLAQVLALATAYRRGIPVTGIPVGITKGALPKVTDTGYVPPANPGAPTAIGTQHHKAKRTKHSTTKRHTSTKPSTTTTRSSSPTPATTSPSAPPSSSSPTTSPSSSPSPSPSKSCNKLTQNLHLCPHS